MRFFLFIIPGNNRFDSKSAAAYLNSGHLSFASSEDLKELMNTFPGAVSLLGLVYDKNHRIEVFIDESLLKAERIDCHPCRNDMSLVLSMNELLKKFFPSLGISYEAVPSEFLNGMKK